jgi:hypothetical protein
VGIIATWGAIEKSCETPLTSSPGHFSNVEKGRRAQWRRFMKPLSKLERGTARRLMGRDSPLHGIPWRGAGGEVEMVHFAG